MISLFTYKASFETFLFVFANDSKGKAVGVRPLW